MDGPYSDKARTIYEELRSNLIRYPWLYKVQLKMFEYMWPYLVCVVDAGTLLGTMTRLDISGNTTIKQKELEKVHVSSQAGLHLSF